MQGNQINSNDKTESQLELLDNQFKDILSKKSDESNRKIFFFIKRTLRQFRLDSQLQESDILIEAYLRVRTIIESGKYIQNMPAFLNRVAFNIIREHSRKQRRNEDLSSRLIHDYIHSYSENTDATLEVNKILSKSLKELNPEDIKLIQLRIVEGLSWNEIAEYLNSCNEKDDDKKILSTSSLRKRGERALKRLRAAYFKS